MDANAGKLIEGLSSLAIEEFKQLRDLKDDKKRMESTVSAINAVLLQANSNATSDPQVCDWLEKLKEVLYDADDWLDDFSAEELARKVMTGTKIAKEVRIFFSKSNQLAYGRKMSGKMKEIRKKLNDIADDKNKLPQIPCSSRAPIGEKQKRQTGCFVREDRVIGRDVEKNCILSHLFDTKVNDNLSLITIDGMGGMGKTCLAQLVYNDVAVQNYFELKMWVCVSDTFDLGEIGQKMVGSGTNANLPEVQEELRNKIRGRRFLLVLDDVWTEDRDLWLDLKSLLMEGGKGSTVIITTRFKKITKITGAHMNLNLERLDKVRSWRLFSQLAFEEGKEPNDPELVAIAKEICKKCGGVPLAIRTMANLLCSTDSDWSSIMNNELLSSDPENNKISDILRLSYDHLYPPNLKNCFAYCSLFPKDFDFDKKTLIQLWIAQGFIPSSNRDKCSENVGHDYFMNLLSRCFFQDVQKDEFDDIKSCKMHDLMHDLARLVSHECTIIKEGIIGDRENDFIIIREENKEMIGDRVRHLFIDIPWECVWKVQTSLLEGRKLRTYFFHGGGIAWEKSSESIGCYGRRGGWSRRVACNWGKFRTSSLPGPWRLERLRVLSYHDRRPSLSIIPESIGKLKHLRYLNLSNNAEIKKLPRSITRLHNLQTLKLNRCVRLEELPRDINKMVSLRHLELDDCYDLSWMPQGLGQLISLQTMTRFSLNPRKSDSARLSELGDLKNLKGRLSICDLQHLRGNTEKVELAKLFQKQHLQHLGLFWGEPSGMIELREKDHHKDEMILQALRPHHSIKSLKISGCFIKMLPDWIRNLSSLHILCLDGLYSSSIPDNVGILSSLRRLEIADCPDLIYLPESIGNLSSLQELRIFTCKHLVSLPDSIRNLSSLQELEFYICDGLASLPEGMRDIRSLQWLRIFQCPLLEERCKREEGEDWQKIAHVPNVSFTLDQVTSFQLSLISGQLRTRLIVWLSAEKLIRRLHF